MPRKSTKPEVKSKPKSTKSKPKPKPKPKYKLEVFVNGEVFTSEGDTVLDLFRSFPQPDLIKTDLTAVIKKGDKVATKSVNTFKARQVLRNRVALELFAVSLEKRLG